jgi:hypothetical protein
MEDFGAIDEMSSGMLLDFLGALGVEQRRTEALVLQAAVQHAVLNDASTVDPVEARLPGREQAVRYGGAGTPRVAEFAAAELGARLGISTFAGRALIADGLDLVHRLPRLWARVQALEVPARFARLVARQTRDLTCEQADHVDERVAEFADGRLSWTRFETLVEAVIKAADPETAAQREAEAAAAQFASASRSDEHGMRGFYVRAPFAVIARLDATVAYVAEALTAFGDADGLDARRVKAILLLANPAQAAELLAAYAEWKDRPADPDEPATEPDRTGPKPEIDWSKLLPVVQLFVHLYAGVDLDGVVRVEGAGPMTEAWLRDHLGPHARFTIRPVLDLAGQVPVDAYEVPERHRQAVHLMTPADTFPFSSSISRSHQIDHTEPYGMVRTRREPASRGWATTGR